MAGVFYRVIFLEAKSSRNHIHIVEMEKSAIKTKKYARNFMKSISEGTSLISFTLHLPL